MFLLDRQAAQQKPAMGLMEGMLCLVAQVYNHQGVGRKASA